MISIDDDSDTPSDGVKGIALRFGAFSLCAIIALAGFWMAFPSPIAPELLPIPPVSPRIAQNDDYDHCLNVLATDPTAATQLADAWFATGGGDPAAHCLALSHIALGDTESAAEALAKLSLSKRLSPLGRGVVEDQEAQAWMMAHNLERAYMASTLALSVDPDEIDWLVDRAEASVALGRFSDALEDLNRALLLDPSRNQVRVLRGAAWRRLNQLPQARADMDVVLSNDPDNPSALLERGVLHWTANRRSEARADWRHVIAAAPAAPEAIVARQNLERLDSGGAANE